MSNELNPEDIELLVWNVAKCRAPSWSQDFLKLAYGTDLVLLQEAYLNAEAKSTWKKLDEMGWHMAVSFIDLSFVPTGVKTGSIVKPKSITYHKTQHTEPITNTPKMALATEYKLRGCEDTLLVVNIHGINFVFSFIFQKQIKQLEAVMKNHKGPIIFAGDFNTWNRRRLSAVHEMAKTLSLKEVPFGEGRKKAFNFALDRVFVRGLRVLETRVHVEIESSDHKPLFLRLRKS